jgi:hypothetical protein
MKKTKPITVILFALALASFLAKAKYGFLGMHDGV